MDDKAKEKAEYWFGSGKLFCAETVLKIIGSAADSDLGPALAAASGFCSGAARTKGQCGALSGAILALGLYGSTTETIEDVARNRETVYELTEELVGWFKDTYGSINCFELTGCDFRTSEGRERFRENGVKNTCVAMCAETADVALALLRETGRLPELESLIRARVAPCGLSCGKCVAYGDSSLHRAARDLADGLGDNFGGYAARFAAMNPAFKDYEGFRRLLDFLAAGTCSGCREQGCLFQACKVPGCVKEHEVDYCFECAEFPCDRHGMPGPLAHLWRANNEKMAEIGLEAWFEGCRKRPRYP